MVCVQRSTNKHLCCLYGRLHKFHIRFLLIFIFTQCVCAPMHSCHYRHVWEWLYSTLPVTCEVRESRKNPWWFPILRGIRPRIWTVICYMSDDSWALRSPLHIPWRIARRFANLNLGTWPESGATVHRYHCCPAVGSSSLREEHEQNIASTGSPHSQRSRTEYKKKLVTSWWLPDSNFDGNHRFARAIIF